MNSCLLYPTSLTGLGTLSNIDIAPTTPWLYTSEREQLRNAAQFVIIDAHWINGVVVEPAWLGQRFSPRLIVETFASIPTDQDSSCKLWGEIETRFSDEEIKNIDLYEVEEIFEKLVTLFYSHTEKMLGSLADNYLFHAWADNNTIVLQKEARYDE